MTLGVCNANYKIETNEDKPEDFYNKICKYPKFLATLETAKSEQDVTNILWEYMSPSNYTESQFNYLASKVVNKSSSQVGGA
ncbi:MAG: hypothetical protein HRU28_11885 [Rhizobiales bacterium]|nr:hypothetical protein [Hyphomicrobiales bacterium]